LWWLFVAVANNNFPLKPRPRNKLAAALFDWLETLGVIRNLANPKDMKPVTPKPPTATAYGDAPSALFPLA
jgi:hypothetical protein